jgi:hypothetical protein
MSTKCSSVIYCITSIRVYAKEEYFIEKFMGDSDLNDSAKFAYNGVTRWFELRVYLLAVFLSLAIK